MAVMETLIKEIIAYCEAKGITPGTFGSYALNDGKFFGRITDSGECLPRTMERARAYMRDNPPPAREICGSGG